MGDAVEHRRRPVAGERRSTAPLSVRKVRSAAASTRATTVAVGTSSSTASRQRTPARRSASRCQTARSAPTRASSRTSRQPERAAQQATLAPAPPGRVRIRAEVSVPWTSAVACRATTSVTTSPTTSRPPPLIGPLLVIDPLSVFGLSSAIDPLLGIGPSSAIGPSPVIGLSSVIDRPPGSGAMSCPARRRPTHRRSARQAIRFRVRLPDWPPAKRPRSHASAGPAGTA